MTWFLIHSLEMISALIKVIKFLENSISQWETNLEHPGEKSANIKIKRGISPLIFVIALLPLSVILKAASMSYKFKNGSTFNHFLFMDDLKQKIKKNLETL